MERNTEQNIKKLVRVNLDAFEGYKTAADNVNDSLLNTFLNQCSNDRKNYATALAEEINITPEEISTHFKADLHRVWIDLKTSPQRFSAKTVLRECKRGEKYTIETYDDIIAGGSYPPTLEEQIKYQRSEIISKYNRIIEMEKEYDQKDDKRNKQTSVP
ncbi:PA2169 family four-helix-bundle protein [Fulvivirga ulvae]|uniref:PA2169 family four-helix-bundle protein n=1 Tax=Fulvivirga ulvae TaxID=2904245 RepID=UPI001F184D1B|nr:PA2169 family four-helix-bundle protein [Fulvivirga ulvae]UII31021.1 PA2169 family four-helix-bundle protein [Fulvivirga ulvae]